MEGMEGRGGRHGEGGRGNIDVLFYLSMHLLVDSWRCSDWESNPQPWPIGTRL